LILTRVDALTQFVSQANSLRYTLLVFLSFVYWLLYETEAIIPLLKTNIIFHTMINLIPFPQLSRFNPHFI